MLSPARKLFEQAWSLSGDPAGWSRQPAGHALPASSASPPSPRLLLALRHRRADRALPGQRHDIERLEYDAPSSAAGMDQEIGALSRDALATLASGRDALLITARRTRTVAIGALFVSRRAAQRRSATKQAHRRARARPGAGFIPASRAAPRAVSAGGGLRPAMRCGSGIGHLCADRDHPLAEGAPPRRIVGSRAYEHRRSARGGQVGGSGLLPSLPRRRLAVTPETIESAKYWP